MEKRPICLLTLIYVFVILIFTSADVRNGMFLSSADTALEDGKKVWVYGEVIKKEPKSESLAVTIKNAGVINSENQKYKMLVYVQNDNSCQIGDKIKIHGKIKRLQVSTNKGMFNAALYYKAKGIHYILNADKVEVEVPEENDIREIIYRIRMKLYYRLYRIFEEDTAAMLGGILLGIKNDIEGETRELYQKAGIFHLISISGLHVSCIGLALYRVLRKSGGSFAFSGIAASVFLVFYAVLSGNSVSAVRAVIMAIIMMGAWYLGRTYDMISALSLAALLILAESPYSLYQPGFQLSFGAVLGICLVSPELVQAFAFENQFAKPIFTNLGIQLTTLPLILYYYYEIPLYSLILNLILVPFMSLIICSGIGSLAASFFSIQAGRFLGGSAVFLLWAYERVSEITLRLPCAVLRWGQPSLAGILVYYIILISGTVLIKKMNRKKKRILEEVKYASSAKGREDTINKICFLGILCACLLLKIQKNVPLKITMLDVGQGDCIAVEKKCEEVILIDGGSSDVKEVGKYRIVPFLKAEGIKKIQGIFISHMDNDHISGIKELIEYTKKGEFQIDTIYLPDIASKDEAYQEMENLILQNHIEIVYVSRGMVFESGALRLEVLQPVVKERYAERNEYSMVIQLKYKEFGMLFTGDIEGKGEEELKKSGLLEDMDILKTAHHGSEYTMCEELLNQVKPEATWISCGKDNRYGHPHRALIDRISSFHSEIYITMNQGAITVETDGVHMLLYEKCK